LQVLDRDEAGHRGALLVARNLLDAAGTLAPGVEHQLEVVWAGGELAGHVLVQQPVHYVAEQCLVEGLHAVEGALGDHVAYLARLLGGEDQVLDAAGGDHDLGGGEAALAIGAGHESLRDRRPQGRSEHHTGLILMVGREEVDDPVDRLGGIQRVQCGEDQVAGLGRRQRSADSLLVAHLPIRITSGSWRITRRIARPKLGVTPTSRWLMIDVVAMQVDRSE
jgi:hypothetical protein